MLDNRWLIPATLGTSSLLGFLCGQLMGHRHRSATRILHRVVRNFKQEGNVSGSWIDHHARPFQRFAFKTDVYRGGIERQEDNQFVNYLFLADAYTGSILQIKRVTD